MIKEIDSWVSHVDQSKVIVINQMLIFDCRVWEGVGIVSSTINNHIADQGRSQLICVNLIGRFGPPLKQISPKIELDKIEWIGLMLKSSNKEVVG